MPKIPSDKQIELAESISRRLGIPLPDEFSAKAYWDFTQANLARASSAPNPPSSRQIRTANLIADTLHVPLPAEFSAKAYWDFTSRNIDASRAAATRTRRPSRRPSNPTSSRLAEQRRADWEATHLSSACHATRILDGEVGAPSWWDGSDGELRAHLRDLGFRSSAERAEEDRRNQEWGGLIGDPEDW